MQMNRVLEPFDEVASTTIVSTCIANFLTIDVEEYFHVNYSGLDMSALRNGRTNIEVLLDRLLALFADARIRCTFFTLGEIGEKYPGMVRTIHAAGHEVATHGQAHKAIREMTPGEFRDDIERSCGVLESLTGEKVVGFRAPSFSVTAEILPWFYEILERFDLAYSSSVFPGRTFLYGIPGFPQEPHRPVVHGRQVGVMEFPITAFEVLGRRFPLYIRLLSAGTLRRKLRAANRAGCPGILYTHAREIDPEQPRLPLSRGQSLVHYWGIRGCEAKLRQLTRDDLQFGTMRDYVAHLPAR
jgi:polysaccharide deacetylase family protein (PEP-CTERM system associated)